jgi:methylmalonyl-CoA mutase, N-terminal domain
VVPGIEQGYFQREIARSAERQQREIESGERVVVGVNEFLGGNDDADIEILKIGDEADRPRTSGWPGCGRARDDARVEATLERLRQAARDEENVIEPMLDCVRAY